MDAWQNNDSYDTSSNDGDKFAAAQQFLRAVEEFSLPNMMEAARKIQNNKDKPWQLPESIISNSQVRKAANQVLKHGSISVEFSPLSFSLGFKTEF